jgi:hypothetical protein
MKPYSFSDFNKRFNMFGWLHPDIRQTYWTKEDNQWDRQEQTTVRKTFTLSTLWYKDMRMLQFYTNDEANGSRRLSVYNFYRDAAHETGLVTSPSYRINASTIIDALYYKANAPVYYNQNGTIKKGFWGALKRRLRSQAMRTSWVTEHMLREAVDIASNPLEIEDAVMPATWVKDYLDNKDIPNYAYYQDFLTTKYHVEGSQRRIRLGSTQWTEIHKSTDPRLYGYTFNEEHDIWLKPDQFYHTGQIWNRDEVDIVECSQCHNESVSELCIDGVCHHCLDASFKIHNYSTRVESMLKFKATRVKPNTVYLGCELEYETNNRNRAQLGVGKLMHGHALMKSDGSIRNGFEIVTCPATLDIHLQVFKSFFDNLPPDLKIEKNVGMHVHISRKPLSHLTLGKLTEFLNRQDNKQFIAHIAGRIDNNYARMDNGRNVTYPWRNKHGGDRYNALNLNNQNTVEVRLFATPMNYKEFASRLQFVQALVDYCMPAQSNESLKKQTHYEAFMHWLSSRKRMFPELSYHLKEFV